MSHDMWIPCVRNDYIIVHNDYDMLCAMSCPLRLLILFDLSIITLGLPITCVLYMTIISIINIIIYFQFSFSEMYFIIQATL
jgi:hypothetical protein